MPSSSFTFPNFEKKNIRINIFITIQYLKNFYLILLYIIHRKVKLSVLSYVRMVIKYLIAFACVCSKGLEQIVKISTFTNG